jgi:DNA-directed RNA polymerase subunit RPC12/RpoP/predicted outer membrane lipoprotein
MADAPRWKWLDSTHKLQETHYGLDYGSLVGEKLAEYFMIHYTALTCELVEFMDEVNWKPWMKDNRGEVLDRDAAVGELIDAAHFLANLACAIGVTDAEWEEKYQAKQERNRRRQESGSYTKAGYKCPDCRRELDRPGAIVRKIGMHPEYYCFACMTGINITHRCDQCGLIEPKLITNDGVGHCDNCGHAVLV